jgi:hypothetical protein
VRSVLFAPPVFSLFSRGTGCLPAYRSVRGGLARVAKQAEAAEEGGKWRGEAGAGGGKMREEGSRGRVRSKT